MPDPDDRLLVEAAQRDPARFAALYERHFERVYAFVVRRVRDRDAAEDVTADVFHKALANLRAYEWRGAPFAAWLFRIAANAIADRARRSAREVVNSDSLPDVGAAPAVDDCEDYARLFRLVDELPDDQRTVVLERFVDQRSIHDIAERLGRSDGAVKQLQFRALHNLRKWMEGADA